MGGLWGNFIKDSSLTNGAKLNRNPNKNSSLTNGGGMTHLSQPPLMLRSTANVGRILRVAGHNELPL